MRTPHEDGYLNACRAHRSEWLEALAKASDKARGREQEVIEHLRQLRLDRHNVEWAYRLIEDLGDPSQISDPAKANAYAMLDFHEYTRLDSEDERWLAEFGEKVEAR